MVSYEVVTLMTSSQWFRGTQEGGVVVKPHIFGKSFQFARVLKKTSDFCKDFWRKIKGTALTFDNFSSLPLIFYPCFKFKIISKKI